MSTNKKGIASQALIEMDSIMESMKQESKSTMKALLSEAVKDAIRDSVNEDDENDYEVVDGEQETAENGTTQEPQAQQATPQAPAAGEEAGNDWSEFEQYKVGDDTYDLTGVEDNDTVVKVYKLLKDEDQVVIKKDGSKVDLKDNETGAEYVIDLGEDDDEMAAAPMEDGMTDEMPDATPEGDATEEAEAEPEDNEEQQLAESVFEFDIDEYNGSDEVEDWERGPIDDEDDDDFDFEMGSDEEGFDDEEEPEFDIDDEEDVAGFSDDDFDEDESLDPSAFKNGENEEGTEGMQFENKKNNKKTMKESKEVLFEIDLGYTDNYQKEDPIGGLSNNEPSKSGKSWHKGLPTGTEKPWAGSTNGKGDPFAKEVNEEFDECGNGLCEEDDFEMDSEIEEAATSKSRRDRRHTTKTNSKSTGDAAYNPQVTKVDNGSLQESLKKLKKENKALKDAVVALKGNLQEAYITNVNLGKITKLFLENTTTKAEKVDIINRFTNEAKTVEQANTLFESIDKQLKKAPKMSQIAENNAGKTMTGSLNENKTHRSKDVMEVIDFMNRMQNC